MPNRTRQPKQRERRGAARGAAPGPYRCKRCGSGPYLRLDGLNLHMVREHTALGPRGRSLALDAIRWPGSAQRGGVEA